MRKFDFDCEAPCGFVASFVPIKKDIFKKFKKKRFQFGYRVRWDLGTWYVMELGTRHYTFDNS